MEETQEITCEGEVFKSYMHPDDISGEAIETLWKELQDGR
jgi:hypothetical protein